MAEGGNGGGGDLGDQDIEISRAMVKRKTKVFGVGSEIISICSRGELALTSASDRIVFRGMYQTLDKLYERFNAFWEDATDYAEEFEPTPTFPTDDDEVYRSAVKDSYYMALGYHAQLVAPVSGGTSLQGESTRLTSNSSARVLNSSMLPPIDLKVFHGDQLQWPTFKSLFTSVVIDDPNLSNAQRFHYLLSKLDGYALSTVKHLCITNENFPVAWDGLCRQYDNRRKLAGSFLARLLSYKPHHTGRPSADSLQQFLANVTDSISSLENLNIPNFANYLLCELALRCLDPVTRESFEVKMVNTEFPDFASLRDFVQERCRVLRLTQESMPKLMDTPTHSHPIVRTIKPPNKFTPAPRYNPALLAHGSESSGGPCCFVCKGSHAIRDCSLFKSLSPSQRLEKLKKFPGCTNCLHVSHKQTQCSSSWNCRFCQKRHNSLLHVPDQVQRLSGPGVKAGNTNSPNPQNIRTQGRESNPRPSDGSGSGAFTGASTSSEGGVLLGTIRASILGAQGRKIEFRGILDPGSMFSFVTAECADLLEKKASPFRGIITGVDSARLTNIQGRTSVTFVSRSADPLTTEAVVVPTITPPLPQHHLKSSMWDDYFKYDLSDPTFTSPSKISFLIGADLYPDVVTGTPVVVRRDGPRLLNTIFGHTVIGRYRSTSPSNTTNLSLCTVGDPGFQLQRFWELEEPLANPNSAMSPSEQQCEAHFQSTHNRNPEGRYVVSLPFTSPSPTIIPNVARALSRFYALEQKLEKNQQLKRDYHEFMAEYLNLNHMSIATTEPSYLIPHHPVYKTSLDGVGKLRVVFDASFRTPTGSLNDHLHIGPKLQSDIGTIILTFRLHKYALSCDIVKMFRQVLINPEHRKYQQIAWRFSPSDPIMFFELNTVTYGLRSSPYHAQRVLKQLVVDEGANYPLASYALTNCLYVDDIPTGANTIADLFNIRDELMNLLDKGGFKLSKWKSNYPPALKGLETDGAALPLGDREPGVSKILGMVWDPVTDVLRYDIRTPKVGNTKREVLSTIAQLFDPLGYLSPVIFHAKCLLQSTWKAGVGWDDPVPPDVLQAWLKFVDGLPSLANIEIPRYVITSKNDYHLLCFSDASELGYCGVVYLLGIHDHGNSLSLLKAKTRLAPIKRITIPRLELCGAYLLSQIIASLKSVAERLQLKSIFCFTDSTTVLAWLNTPAYRLNTFVGNRVQKTLEEAPASWWHHIKGADNPADVGSRGLSPSALQHHQLWWSGPGWCSQPIQNWPISRSYPAEEIPELKPDHSLAMTARTSENDLVKYMERHSKLPRLIRVLAYVRRFIFNAKRTNHARRIGPVSTEEFDEAHNLCIRVLQRHHFPSAVSECSRAFPPELRNLSPFVDSEGVIRVGGRLRKAPLSLNQRHPILLPSRSHFTYLVIDHIHRSNHHAGPSACLAFIRQRYWVPSARNFVRLHYINCVICRRHSNAFVQPPMGDLPSARVEGGFRAFLECGVDLGGPFHYRSGFGRSSRTQKCYLVLFICLATRAVHLELCTSLSVESFLDSFDCFIYRRGVPLRMYSDCGTNFIGTANYFEELRSWFDNPNNQSSIVNHSAHMKVKWHFNPPSAPHFGGSWEAGIKSAKRLLHRTIGAHSYTLHELNVVFTKIEGILNSRPLQPLSTCPSDAEALTPGHFIIGQPINSLPEPDLSSIPANRLNRWQLIRSRIQHFWTRWQSEYLQTLQARQKWLAKSPNVKPGDIVLIRKCSTAPTLWPLAKVEEVHPGSDGVVRVATVRTSQGVLKRPSVDLIRLIVPE